MNLYFTYLIAWIFVDLEILYYSIKNFYKCLELEWEGENKCIYMWKTNILTMIIVFIVIDFLYLLIEFLNNNLFQMLKTVNVIVHLLWRITVWRILKYWLKKKDIFHKLLYS